MLRTNPTASLLLTGALTLAALAAGPSNPASAQSPITPRVPRNPASVLAPRSVGNGRAAAVSPAAYWGPAAPTAPKRKPSAVRRLFNRVGTFLGADEEMGTTPVYRDPTTGRTNTGGSKPFMGTAPQ